jgi:hypothetical protein
MNVYWAGSPLPSKARTAQPHMAFTGRLVVTFLLSSSIYILWSTYSSGVLSDASRLRSHESINGLLQSENIIPWICIAES